MGHFGCSLSLSLTCTFFFKNQACPIYVITICLLYFGYTLRTCILHIFVPTVHSSFSHADQHFVLSFDEGMIDENIFLKYFCMFFFFLISNGFFLHILSSFSLFVKLNHRPPSTSVHGSTHSEPPSVSLPVQYFTEFCGEKKKTTEQEYQSDRALPYHLL